MIGQIPYYNSFSDEQAKHFQEIVFIVVNKRYRNQTLVYMQQCRIVMCGQRSDKRKETLFKCLIF